MGLRLSLGVGVKSTGWIAAAVAGVTLVASDALAQDRAPSRLTLGAGAIGIGSGTDAAFSGSIEWQGAQPLFWRVAPLAGALATSDGATYVFAGVHIDFPIAEHWYFTPSVAVGGYSEGGGKDLGHGVEFRSQGEVWYRISANRHIGLSIYHLSNAGIGDRNPGTNGAAATYSVSLPALRSLLP
jgi:hypothetical protein